MLITDQEISFMATQTRLVSADQFFAMPDDGFSHELVRGEVITMSLPGGRHGKIASRIVRLLGNYTDPRNLGDVYPEVGFLIERNPDTVRGPDVAVVAREKLSRIVDHTKFIPFAPDLAVEVVSPNDRAVEVQEKAEMWIEHGARLVWVVDPKSETVTVHRPGAEPRTLSGDDPLDGEGVIPGFRCRAADCFA
jgi:Uma2 family endonuclease